MVYKLDLKNGRICFCIFIQRPPAPPPAPPAIVRIPAFVCFKPEVDATLAGMIIETILFTGVYSSHLIKYLFSDN